MGTRSLTKIYDENNNLLVTMYRQYDGYPTGHGRELAEFLKDMVLVNGICSGQPEKKANGMGCLSAQIIAHFKDDVGGIYIVKSVGATGYWEDYIYTVEPSEDKKSVRIECFEYGATIPIFKGTPVEFLKWMFKFEEDEIE